MKGSFTMAAASGIRRAAAHRHPATTALLHAAAASGSPLRRAAPLIGSGAPVSRPAPALLSARRHLSGHAVADRIQSYLSRVKAAGAARYESCKVCLLTSAAGLVVFGLCSIHVVGGATARASEAAEALIDSKIEALERSLEKEIFLEVERQEKPDVAPGTEEEE